MALTILIKFCGFIVHSKPNNMTLSAFLEKSLKLEKGLSRRKCPVFKKTELRILIIIIRVIIEI